MARREQRAAVLVGNDRDRIRPEPLRLRGDLFLVHPDQRPQHRQRRDHFVDAIAMFSIVCDATWPTTSPVTSACAPMPPREPLGDAHHQAAVDRRRAAAAGRRGRPAAGSRRTARVAAATALKLRQQLRQLARLFLRRARQDRIAVKVHEQRRGSRGASCATPRPANRCRPTAGRRPGRSRPTGRPPAPALLAEEVERLVGQRLDVDRELRVRRFTVQSARFLDAAADLALDLAATSAESACRRAAPTRGRCRGSGTEVLQDLRAIASTSSAARARLREVADAEDARRAGRAPGPSPRSARAPSRSAPSGRGTAPTSRSVVALPRCSAPAARRTTAGSCP